MKINIDCQNNNSNNNTTLTSADWGFSSLTHSFGLHWQSFSDRVSPRRNVFVTFGDFFSFFFFNYNNQYTIDSFTDMFVLVPFPFMYVFLSVSKNFCILNDCSSLFFNHYFQCNKLQVFFSATRPPL